MSWSSKKLRPDARVSDANPGMWHQDTFALPTSGRGATDITARVAHVVSAAQVNVGMCHVFVHHTSASLMLCENADPDVQADLEMWFARIVPDADPAWRHSAEGPDDMPAHVRSVLTGASHSVPITAGQLALGTWQGIYLVEHRVRPHTRSLTVTVHGGA